MGAVFALSASAAPQLQCQITYAGVTRTVLAQPVQDPYPVTSVDIGRRFRFKPVVVGTSEQIDRVLIYVYLTDGPHPMLIQQARYLPPFPVPGQGSLTGDQRLYAGALERELIYDCSLQGLSP